MIIDAWNIIVGSCATFLGFSLPVSFYLYPMLHFSVISSILTTPVLFPHSSLCNVPFFGAPFSSPILYHPWKLLICKCLISWQHLPKFNFLFLNVCHLSPTIGKYVSLLFLSSCLLCLRFFPGLALYLCFFLFMCIPQLLL